jgi:hypothetical protein
MESDDFSHLFEPFGFFREWIQETEQDKERFDYGKKKPGRPESKLEVFVGRATERATIHFQRTRQNTLHEASIGLYVVQGIMGFHWLRTELSMLVPPSLAMQREAMRIWDDLLLEE